MLNPWSGWGIKDGVMDEDEFSVRDRIGDIIGGVDGEGEGEGEGEQDYASPLQSQESGTRDPQCDAAQPMTTSMGLIGVLSWLRCLTQASEGSPARRALHKINTANTVNRVNKQSTPYIPRHV